MKKNKNSSSIKKSLNLGVLFSVIILGIIVFFFYLNRQISKDDPLINFFEKMESQEFRANPGLSIQYFPGTIVQIKEASNNKNGFTELSDPIIFKTTSNCFPDIQPIRTPYGIPSSSGKYSDKIDISAEDVSKWLSNLSLEDNMNINYTLQFKDVYLYTIPKGDMSFNFSEECVAALQNQISIGERNEWYSIVYEAIVVNEISYKIFWKRNISTNIQADFKNRFKKKINKIMGSETRVKIKSNAANIDQMTLELTGGAVIAYKLRPITLEVVKND